MRTTQPLIRPIYSQTNPNEPIDFGEVAIAFESGDETEHITAAARLRFTPRDKLEFICPVAEKPPFWAFRVGMRSDSGLELTLVDRHVKFDADLVGADKDGLVIGPRKSGVEVTRPTRFISAVTFHLFNFPDFNGPESYILLSGNPPHQGVRRLGRSVLKANGWVVTIAATDRTKDLVQAIKQQGGHCITHIGRIVRDDGSTFSSSQLDGLLSCLSYFLSFALGRWSCVALPVGVDALGKRIHEEWGLRIIADGPWPAGSSWFDAHHAELLSQVFPGFFSLWSNDTWQRPLTNALYWYFGATDRGASISVDTTTVHTQAALETLAWTHCVQDRQMVSPRAFGRGGLAAADKIRLLLSSLGIPRDIPNELCALSARVGQEWSDGPEAITQIRNSLVHPNKQSTVSDDAYYDCWRLSLWYIDLVILRLCRHDGKYANRLKTGWVGAVESVPWASG